MKSPLVLVAVAGSAAVIASGASAATARVATPPPTVTIATAGGHYNVKSLSAPAGTPFLLVFRNLTAKQHNVSLEQGELEYGATLTIGKGSTASMFTLKKGTYHFYSSVGNDENTGMSGTLTVK